MTEQTPQLTGDQRQVLTIILEFFLENRRWPTYRWLDQIAYVEHTLEFESVYAGLPPGLVLPPADPLRGGPRPEGTLSLTLSAIIALEATDLLAPLLATVRYLGERAATYIPPDSGSAELIVSSSEVAAATGISADDRGLALARELVTNSLWEMWSGSHADAEGDWAISLRPDKARAYHRVRSIDDVLDVHEPIASQRQRWAQAVGAEPEAAYTEPEPDGVQSDAVFVVYGRNELARAAIFEFLAELGLEPLSWDKLLPRPATRRRTSARYSTPDFASPRRLSCYSRLMTRRDCVRRSPLSATRPTKPRSRRKRGRMSSSKLAWPTSATQDARSSSSSGYYAPSPMSPVVTSSASTTASSSVAR